MTEYYGYEYEIFMDIFYFLIRTKQLVVDCIIHSSETISELQTIAVLFLRSVGSEP
jgi:hypothetical protein